MPDAHKNFAYSLVATAPSPAASGTSLVVTAGQGALFPAVPFNATIWPTAAQPLSTTAEIARVTAVSTDTLTIIRAQEETSARTVVVGDQIAATITANTLTEAEIGTRLPPTSGIENFARLSVMTGAAGTSGTLRMAAIWLPAGLVVTSIVVANGGTAEAGGSNAWAALYDSSRNLLRQSTSETGAAAITASVIHTFTLTSTFQTTYTGLHYIGVCVVATTMPNIISAASGNAVVMAIPPILGGNTTDTGLTGTAPNPAAAITSAVTVMYAYVL